jgi:hypothetical protein
MSDQLFHHHTDSDPQATRGDPSPDGMGAGRAQRSQPERSDGERSGERVESRSGAVG